MNESKPFMKNQSGEVISKAPSNIALIKYWGKYPDQIPANPSISYTLTKSYTETHIQYATSGNFKLNFTFEGKPNQAFQQKIEKYFLKIKEYLPFIGYTEFTIDSRNTFPHSSGIASSASAFAALALGLMEIDAQLENKPIINFQKASFLARLGSGSACRSVYKKLVEWGKTEEIENSSDTYAIPYPYEVPDIFLNMCDYIAIIHKGQKEVSSSLGHSLMENHPFAAARFQQANDNILRLKKAMEENDLNAFGEIVESEALSLHAMMLTSNPSFILMDTHSLTVIKAVRNFRKETGLPLFFTLDAGANVHLLFPTTQNKQIIEFIEKEVRPLCVDGMIIKDEVANS